MREQLLWNDQKKATSRKYTCGHCSREIASEFGWYALRTGGGGTAVANIYLCHYCTQPTYFSPDGMQWPGISPGSDVQNLPQSIDRLYNEARDCVAVNAFTASVLCSRKLLMNIAVQEGANVGLKFIEYVEFLSGQGYVPPKAKTWVDHIRTKGNEATHEIADMTQADAIELINFLEMILRFIYDFPARVPGTATKK